MIKLSKAVHETLLDWRKASASSLTECQQCLFIGLLSSNLYIATTCILDVALS